jgi:prevent-host-death family protein
MAVEMAMSKTMGAAEFRKRCLQVIDEVARDHEPVTITKRGKPVAVLAHVEGRARRGGIIGAMRGSVLRYDCPFVPAIEPEAWEANR